MESFGQDHIEALKHPPSCNENVGTTFYIHIL